MTVELENSLQEYVSARRLQRQIEIARHLAEGIQEARSREAALEIAEADQRSRSFLDALLRRPLALTADEIANRRQAQS